MWARGRRLQVALGREWIEPLAWPDETAAVGAQVLAQRLAIAEPLERDGSVERLPIASAVWVVQGTAPAGVARGRSVKAQIA